MINISLEKKIKSKISFRDSHKPLSVRQPHSNYHFKYKTKTYDGYLPTLKFYNNLYRSTDIFGKLINDFNTVKYSSFLDLFYIYRTFIVKRNRLRLDEPERPEMGFVIGLLNSFIINGKPNYLIDSIYRRDENGNIGHYPKISILDSDFEIFTLGLLKINAINTNIFSFQGRHVGGTRLNFYPDDLKMLVSNKLYDTKYMRSKYTSNIKKVLLQNVIKAKLSGIEIQVVSPEYFRNYLKGRIYTKSNSLMEMIDLEKRVKQAAEISFKKEVELTAQ